MKTKISLIILLLLAAQMAHASNERPLLIGGLMTKPTPPYYWVDPCNNMPTGSSIQVLRKILDKMDVKYQFAEPNAMTLDGMRSRKNKLSSGEYDALIALLKIEDGTPNILYSQYPIVTLQDAMLYRKNDRFTIESPEDAAGLTGVIVSSSGKASGTKLGPWLESKGFSFIIKRSRKEALETLMEGGADYMIIERYRAIATFMDKNRTDMELVPIKDSVRKLYFAVNKDSPLAPLLPAINEEIGRYENTGRSEMLRYSYLRAWLNMGNCGIQ